MKDHTVKLSGHAKDRFLERFFAEEKEIDADTRQRLVGRSTWAFSSLRVRKAVLARQRTEVAPPKAKPEPTPQVAAQTLTAAGGAAASEPAVAEGAASVRPAASVDAGTGTRPAAAFDAYAVKLVPVFQREGRDGLLAKLAEVAAVDHLRQIAKAQQVVLPQGLRTGDVDPDAVRVAMVDAVAKRIADRRAAAG